MSPLTRPKIALFVGSDIVAHREMHPVVVHMVQNGYEPVLFYPKHLPSSNVNASQQEFKDYAYVERLILREAVFPHLELDPTEYEESFLTPQQICKKYHLTEPVDVDNINDPEFFNNIPGFEDMIGTFSLRCTQMFKTSVTEHLKSDGRFLLNLHSGLLPLYRGLYATPRAVFEAITKPEGPCEFGCTLHHVDPFKPIKDDVYAGIDTGNIVGFRARKIDPKLSIYATNIQLSNMGSRAVINAINHLTDGDSLSGYPQKDEGRYFSYASPAELQDWKDAGVTMFTRPEVTRILIETFSRPYTDHAARLETVITAAMTARFGAVANDNVDQKPKAKKAANGHTNGHANGHTIQGQKLNGLAIPVVAPAEAFSKTATGNAPAQAPAQEQTPAPVRTKARKQLTPVN